MKPESLTENLMFTTVRLQSSHGHLGTGFFYTFDFGDAQVPVLITNKHVVEDNPKERMTFLLHLDDGDGSSSGNFQVTLDTVWQFHPTQDLCFCYINLVFDEIKKRTGKNVFYRTINKNIVADDKTLQKFSANEQVVMIGYPIGLWDESHNFPIFRRGFTASHPAYDFNKNGMGLVDMACFPGSSGSPIFVLNEGSFVDKHGNVNLGTSRIYFIGILVSVPVYDANGEIVVDTSLKGLHTETLIMTNLGNYIKAEELAEFRPMIESILND